MKAISLWQPWATLCVIGEKEFETRHWFTRETGVIAIHAAKRKPCIEECNLEILLALAAYGLKLEELPLGAYLGTVNLLRCHEAERIAKAYPHQIPYGNFEPGRFAWELADAVEFDKPIPGCGFQGFWTWQQDGEKSPQLDLL